MNSKMNNIIQLPKYVWIMLGIALFVAFNIFFAQQITKKQTLESEAAASTATLSIKPSESTSSKDQTFQLWVVSDNPVGFAQLDVSFDQTKMQLTKEVALDSVLSNTPLGENDLKLNKTSMADANATGNIRLMLALPVQATAPTGAFNIASLVFTPIATESTSTVIQIPPAAVQIFDMNANQFTVQIQNATVTVMR